MRSALPRAVDRAALIFSICESGTTPLPKGVGRKGNCVFSINSVNYWLAYTAPFPIITKGFFAVFKSNNALVISLSLGVKIGT